MLPDYNPPRMENEVILDLPKTLFKKNYGFTMDFGGSAMKIIYTTEEGDKTRLHFVTYSREQHDEAFAMLKEKCGDKLESGSEIFTCGLGASEYNEQLTKLFGLKFTNTQEIDRLCEGFCFMAKHLPWTDFVHPVSQTAMSYGRMHGESMSFLMNMPAVVGNAEPWKFKEVAKAKARREAGLDEVIPDPSVHFPTIVCLVGSAAVFLQINEDGSYRSLDFTPTAGRTFLGLGSILSDGKSYSELCELAGRGNPSKVDVHSEALQVNPDDEIYSAMKTEMKGLRTFSFGQGVDKKIDEFKQEDLVCSLVPLVVEPIVMTGHYLAMNLGIKQVFFIGGFPCDNDHIREEFARAFAYKRYLNFSDYTCDFHFLKLGQHCGSIGTILKNLELKSEFVHTTNSNEDHKLDSTDL